ncbi:hypothetical protein TWF718_000242 [Orbilia javanica]|uniref:Uncharacterized protein n=1 Tax=Orbilia javanica TaxID=47235 RepID=A0AAN8MZD6_9PEZI
MKWQSVEVRRNVQDPETIPNSGRKGKSSDPAAGPGRLGGPYTVVEVDSSEEMSKILRAIGLADFLRKAMTGSRD